MSLGAKALNGVLGKFGFEVRRRPERKILSLPRILNEFSKEEVEIAEYILSKSLTVVSPMRLFATMRAEEIQLLLRYLLIYIQQKRGSFSSTRSRA